MRIKGDLKIMKYNNAELNVGNIVNQLNLANENVTIKVYSEVSDISVSGLSISVIYNNDSSTKQTITTNNKGVATISIPAFTHYKIIMPVIANTDIIEPIDAISINPERIFSVTYKSPVRTEIYKIHCLKLTGQTLSDYVDCPVQITVNDVTTSYTTDENGIFETEFPYGTEYTVTVDNLAGHTIWGGTRQWTYTAESITRYQTVQWKNDTIGVFIISDDGLEYTKEEWQTSGRPAEEAVLLKISTAELIEHNSVFGVPICSIISNAKFQSAGINTEYQAHYDDGGENVTKTEQLTRYCIRATATQGIYYTYNLADTEENVQNIASDDYRGYFKTYFLKNKLESLAKDVESITFVTNKTLNFSNGTELHGFLGTWSEYKEMVINRTAIYDILDMLGYKSYGNVKITSAFAEVNKDYNAPAIFLTSTMIRNGSMARIDSTSFFYPRDPTNGVPTSISQSGQPTLISNTGVYYNYVVFTLFPL